jgi:hypothetical protein
MNKQEERGSEGEKERAQCEGNGIACMLVVCLTWRGVREYCVSSAVQTQRKCNKLKIVKNLIVFIMVIQREVLRVSHGLLFQGRE